MNTILEILETIKPGADFAFHRLKVLWLNIRKRDINIKFVIKFRYKLKNLHGF